MKTQNPHPSLGRAVLLTAAIPLVSTLFGCHPGHQIAQKKYALGEYGQARAALVADVQMDETKRTYLYDRMQLAMINLADGLPQAAAQSVDEVFDKLRTQGINADKTVACFFVTEKGVRFWKGEPFEQAMLFIYTAIQKAMSGEWDNARAASLNALFMLTDFGENEQGGRKTGPEIVAAARASKAEAKAGDTNQADPIAASYAAAKTNFVLGYLMAGIANQVLGYADPDRQAEANEHFNSAVELQPELRDLVDRLNPGQFNTILVVDYGLGPTKYRYGMDNVYSAFRQMRGWESGPETLRATVTPPSGSATPPATLEVPPVCDVNTMAADNRWNGVEQLRVAKSYVGSALVTAGAVAGHFNDWAGIGLAAFGAYMKMTAAADTTHCEIMPQRVYVAPLLIQEPGSTVALDVGECDYAHMVLSNLSPPRAPDRAQLRYVRFTPSHASPGWALNGQVLYANDWCSTGVIGPTLPYILGGGCVCKPTAEVLAHYQAAGFLEDMTLNDLKNLYQAEGIMLEPAGDELARCGAHVLEGGNSLECPLPGTAGYLRLFCQEHRPYTARSKEVQALAASLKEKLEPLASGTQTARAGATGQEVR